jgi:hypothetical protein
VSANNTIKKFCTTRHFLAGLGIGLALLTITIPMMMPFIVTNAEATQSNAVAIAEMNSNMGNIDDTLNKLDNTMVKLDDKINKLNLILCDISSGEHC